MWTGVELCSEKETPNVGQLYRSMGMCASESLKAQRPDHISKDDSHFPKGREEDLLLMNVNEDTAIKEAAKRPLPR
jgi:hypothetical protein